MAAIAELERQSMLAGRQRLLSFGLRLAEIARRFAAPDHSAFRNRTPIDDQMMVSAVRRRIARGFKAIPCRPNFTLKGLMTAAPSFGSMKSTRALSALASWALAVKRPAPIQCMTHIS